MMLQQLISSFPTANSRAKMWACAFFVLLFSPNLVADQSQLPVPLAGQVPAVRNQLPAVRIQVPAVIPPYRSPVNGGTITPGPTDILAPGERLSIANHPYFPRIFVEVVVRDWITPPPALRPTLRTIFQDATTTLRSKLGTYFPSIRAGTPPPLGPVKSTYSSAAPDYISSVPVNPQRLPPWWDNPQNPSMRAEPPSSFIRATEYTAVDLNRNYISVPDLDGRLHLIPFEEGTRAELLERLRVNTTLVDSMRTFPRVAGTFVVASMLVDMAACFGGNGFNDLAFDASSASPVCVEQLIRQLTSVEGYLGFFAFHVINGYAHKGISNLLAKTSLYVNKPLTPQIMTELRNYVRFAALGLSFSAVEFMSHIMRNPAMGDCIKAVSSGNMSSSACRAVVSDFLSVDRFWYDFSASFANIMSSAIATGATMSTLKTAWNLTTTQQLRSGVWQLTRGARFSGLVRDIRRVRILKDVVSMAGGPPGWVVVVVTTVGEFAIFLSWQHLLESPVTSGVWSVIDGPPIRLETDRLMGTVETLREHRGFSDDTITTECHTSYRAINGTRSRERVENCSSTENLASSLGSLRKHAQRFRQKVILHDLLKSFPQHLSKWDSFITNYFTGKFVMQEIYRQREELQVKKESVNLYIFQLASVVQNAWEEYFHFLSLGGMDGSVSDSDWLQLRDSVPKLKRAYVDLDRAYRANIQDKTFDYRPAETALINQLLSMKTLTTQGMFSDFDPTMSCDSWTLSYSYLCRALQLMRMVPGRAQDFNTTTLNSNLLLNLYIPYDTTMGLDTLPLQRTYIDYLCSPQNRFSISNPGNGLLTRLFGEEGLSQTLVLPRLVVGYDNDAILQQSCEMNKTISQAPDEEGRRSFYTEAIDISPSVRLEEDPIDEAQFGLKAGAIWTSEKDTYIDPMSFLTDSKVSLISGETRDEAKQWWDLQAVPQILTYYTDFILSFKNMLDNKFLNLFRPEETPQELLAIELSGGVGALLETDSLLDAKITNRGRLDLSLVGHMQTLILSLQKLSAAFNVGPHGDVTHQLFQEKSQKFLVDFAEHLRHFQYSTDPQTLRSEWTSSIQNILEQRQYADPSCFSYGVAKKLFGESVKNKNTRHEQLYNSIATLRTTFAGNAPSTLVYSKIDELTTEDVKKLSPTDYKNYIAMQILQEVYELLSETGIYYDTYLHHLGLYNLAPTVVDCVDKL